MDTITNEDKGLSLIDIVTIVKKNLIYLIISIFIFFCIGIIYAIFILKPVYSSRSTIMVQVTVSGETNNTNDITNALRIVTTVSEFMSNYSVVKEVSEQSGISINEIYSGLKVSFTTNSLNVNIDYQNSDKDLAMQIPNLIVKEAQKQADSTIQVSDTEEKYKFTTIANTISIVSEAETVSIVSMSKKLLVGLFIFIGFIVGLGFIFLKESLNTKVGKPSDLEEYLDIKVIGAIPSYDVKRRKNYV